MVLSTDAKFGPRIFLMSFFLSLLIFRWVLYLLRSLFQSFISSRLFILLFMKNRISVFINSLNICLFYCNVLNITDRKICLNFDTYVKIQIDFSWKLWSLTRLPLESYRKILSKHVYKISSRQPISFYIYRFKKLIKYTKGRKSDKRNN